MVKNFKILFFFWSLSSCCLLLHGQKYLKPAAVQGEPFGVKQGLSQGMINCIYQDKEGYMWICTKDGLNRYDGYNIFTFRNNSNAHFSLPDNYCNATIEDENGNFWLGTNTKGLFLFDKATENFYPVTAVNNSKENLCIKELSSADGKLFIKTWTDELVLDISQVNLKTDKAAGYKAKQIFSYNHWQPNNRYKLELNVNTISVTSWMPDNTLCVSFSDSIFCITPSADFSTCTISSFSPKSFEIDGGIASFFPIKNEPENMVIVNKNAILHFNKKNHQIFYRTNFPKPLTNYRNYQMQDGRIFILADSVEIIYNPKTRILETTTRKSEGLLNGTITSVCVDANGIQWYGSSGFGITKKDLRKKLFKSFAGANTNEFFWKMPQAWMPAVSPQFEGKWVVLDKNKIYWSYFFNNNQGNLFSYNTNTGVTKHYPGLPDNRNIQAVIYNDPNDRLWIYHRDLSKKNYISRMDKVTGTLIAEYTIPECIESPEPYVTQFYGDDEGTIWLATINGLYAFNEKTNSWQHWKNIPDNNNSLSTDGVLSICADPLLPKKYFWIGTEGAGINRFDKQTGNCIRYNEKDGLPNNVAYCILSDSLNNLWISTNKGLSCFNPVQKTFRNFTDDDGLPGNEFNRTIAMQMQNGELMFGGVDGFVIFNPKEVLQKQSAVPLVFTGVSILNKPTNWKTDSSNLDAPVGYAKKLILKPGQNIFSISFATLESRSNTKKMYKYKLEGFDKDWTSPSSKNEVTYTNLSPGKYTFYAMGANTDGEWKDKPISMQIVVLPYWYQTILFKILSLLFLSAALYSFYRYRLAQGLKLEKLRNRIARDLHDEIGSSLSSISFYAESAKKMITGNQKAESILTKINNGTSEMMESMSDIVWALNTGSGHFYDLTNRMRSFAVQATEAKNIGLHFTDNKEIPNIPLNMEQRKNIYLIFKEAASNAIKYSNCSLLEVLIYKESQQLFINIRDNGKGFDIKSYETIKQGHSLGGNGLKNMKGRAAEIYAGLKIISNIDSGTSVILEMPITKS